MLGSCPFTTTAFVEEEKDEEEKAYADVSSIPKFAFVSEFHVFTILFIFLTLIARHLISLPLWIIKSIPKRSLFSTPETRHSFAIFRILSPWDSGHPGYS
jgi:hypothetical protein